jgi:hypothetical protein
MSKEAHSTTQAFEEHPDTISPGPKDGEHPQDLRSRPNDARNDHQASDSGLNDVDYPPQLHAGKVGLGPHYGEQNRPVSILYADGPTQLPGATDDVFPHPRLEALTDTLVNRPSGSSSKASKRPSKERSPITQSSKRPAMIV